MKKIQTATFIKWWAVFSLTSTEIIRNDDLALTLLKIIVFFIIIDVTEVERWIGKQEYRNT